MIMIIVLRTIQLVGGRRKEGKTNVYRHVLDVSSFYQEGIDTQSDALFCGGFVWRGYGGTQFYDGDGHRWVPRDVHHHLILYRFVIFL